MLKKINPTLAGIATLGTLALLLNGCGGGSFSKNTFGNYPNTLPYAYGLEPIAYYGAANNLGKQASIEGSGFQAATGGQAYITGASNFSATVGKNALLPLTADPNATNTLPLGFSTKGQYIDAVNQAGVTVASVASVQSGASVVFRAALANGIADNLTAGITSATLTTTDAELAAVPGLTTGLPMSLNVVTGAFTNATYVTGTGGTPTPFTIPASTTTGLHTVIVTVTDDAGRITATTFIFPVVAPSDAAVLAVVAPTLPEGSPQGATATITSATATITNPIAGANAQATADTQNNVLLFAAPGAQTITVTAAVTVADAKGKTLSTPTQTGTLAVTLAAGGTVPDAAVTVK